MATKGFRAGKRERANSPIPEKFEWAGFVSCSLPPELSNDLEDYVLAFSESDFVAFVEAASMDCKLSFSLNGTGGGVIASLTVQRACNRSAAGRCLTAFAPSAIEALAVLAFKDQVILDGRWDERSPERGAAKTKFG